MPIIFTQTDNTMVCAAATFCSGASLNTDRDYLRQATQGGTAGSTAVTVTVNASAADLICGWYECIVPDGSTWAAGDWVVRLNVTTAQTTVSWDATYICRVNSGCTSQATIGSLTGQAISLSPTGVKSMTVTGSAQTPGAGDKVIIVLLFDNSNSCTRNVGLTPSENIDSPFIAAGPVAGLRILALTGVGI